MEIDKLQKENELIQKEIELRTDFYKQLNFVAIPKLRDVTNEEKEGIESKQIKLSEQDWNRIIENTDAVFNHFTEQLKKTFPKMNTMDIRFCCLVKIQLKQSDIANILNIEKVSIKRRKLRIRKDKMQLDDGRTLDEIIRYF